ncbi:MAG: hypothetical protein ACE5Q6_17250 [Dehalococcoidia bacterium]
MARLWAKTATFESISVGDTLPILVKWETRDTISGFAALLAAGDSADNIKASTGDETEAEALSGRSAPAQALLAYVTELLEKAFPVTRIMARVAG